ncbi:hypothetical protein EDC04DRAFT_547910 [Pisolithus marmoratus]|nr:hypothetical protein EDC04DRAFT_547910 [Pisolithus marmoratus]
MKNTGLSCWPQPSFSAQTTTAPPGPFVSVMYSPDAASFGVAVNPDYSVPLSPEFATQTTMVRSTRSSHRTRRYTTRRSTTPFTLVTRSMSRAGTPRQSSLADDTQLCKGCYVLAHCIGHIDSNVTQMAAVIGSRRDGPAVQLLIRENRTNDVAFPNLKTSASQSGRVLRAVVPASVAKQGTRTLGTSEPIPRRAPLASHVQPQQSSLLSESG